MAFAPWSRKFLALGSLAVLSASLVSFGWSADPPKEKEKAANEEAKKFESSTRCMQCHTIPAAGNSQEFVLLTEYSTWRMQDRHSLAYISLVGDRGKNMAKLLGMDVTKPEAGCLGCHSMYNLPRTHEFQPIEGVSCDGCHGPAKDWFEPHQKKEWREKTAEQKAELGMWDLRNPARRAEVCMSCHVGNTEQGKVITHAMYAAGHPPLPNFEVSKFSNNLPQHWRNKRDVPCFKKDNKEYKEVFKDIYHLDAADYQQAQLVVASSLVGLQEAMRLTASRSDVSATLKDEKKRLARWPELAMKETGLPDDPAQRWPEFALAQADCYSCHHELVRPSWRQKRGYSGAPGRPQLQPWPLSLSDGGIGLGTDEPARQKNAKMRTLVEKVHEACNKAPFGNPALLQKASNTLAQWASNRIEQGKLQETKYSHFALLQDLCSVPGDAYPDYYSARQTVAACKMVYDEWPTKPGKDGEVQKLLNELIDEFDLNSSSARADRLKLLTARLSKSAGLTDNQKLLPSEQSFKAAQQITSTGLEANYPTKGDAAKLAVARQLRTYLSTILTGSGNVFTQELVKDSTFLKEMQAIHDKDLQGALQKVDTYDPKVFKKRMAKLLKLIEPAK